MNTIENMILADFVKKATTIWTRFTWISFDRSERSIENKMNCKAPADTLNVPRATDCIVQFKMYVLRRLQHE